MLDLITFWLAAWRLRDHLTVTGLSLTACLAFAGSYYLAAHLVFPPRDVEAPDLDAHGLRVKHWVLGILFALFVVQVSYFLSVPALAGMLRDPWAIGSVLLFAYCWHLQRWCGTAAGHCATGCADPALRHRDVLTGGSERGPLWGASDGQECGREILHGDMRWHHPGRADRQHVHRADCRLRGRVRVAEVAVQMSMGGPHRARMAEGAAFVPAGSPR
jgi:hypothetical protein